MTGDSGYGPFLTRRGRGNVLTHFIMTVLGAGLAVVLLLAFYSPASGGSGGSAQGSGMVPAPPSSAAPIGKSAQDIAARVRPGVVIINTALRYNSEQAAGTGMVINPSGLVLTNNHVIDDSTSITVTVPATGRTYPATVLGYDKTGDIALIRLQGASGLATVPIGNSAAVKAGEAVVALGNAGGQNTITVAAGQVTALNQTITASEEAGSTSSETLHGMIQANADIVAGDSGGPLAGPAASSAWTPRATTPVRAADSRVRDPGQHRAVGRQPDRGGPGQFRRRHRLSAFPWHLRRHRIGQQPAGPGTAGTAAVRVRGQPGMLRQQRRAGRALGHRARLLRRPRRRDDLRGPGGPGRPTGGAVITAINGQPVGSPDQLGSVLTRFHPGDTISVTWVSPAGQRTTSSIRLTAGPPQ